MGVIFSSSFPFCCCVSMVLHASSTSVGMLARAEDRFMAASLPKSRVICIVAMFLQASRNRDGSTLASSTPSKSTSTSTVPLATLSRLGRRAALLSPLSSKIKVAGISTMATSDPSFSSCFLSSKLPATVVTFVLTVSSLRLPSSEIVGCFSSTNDFLSTSSTNGSVIDDVAFSSAPTDATSTPSSPFSSLSSLSPPPSSATLSFNAHPHPLLYSSQTVGPPNTLCSLHSSMIPLTSLRYSSPILSLLSSPLPLILHKEDANAFQSGRMTISPNRVRNCEDFVHLSTSPSTPTVATVETVGQFDKRT
mmetsp:Transcript_8249/g.17902  ORF Transcript_8249/g.17902 Transcript_8249/m.17902 type:complete len:307 (+) Transcript_8249:504-1424(+)